MPDAPHSGAVRVLDTNGRTVGVGVLVGPRQILTCAHVVNAALGHDRRAQDQPADEVIVEFAVGDGIAGLLLTGTAAPTDIIPARLTANPPAPGQVVDVFGYPGNPPRPHGAWVEATVRGPFGGRLLQLDSTSDSALRIPPGFSGSCAPHRVSPDLRWSSVPPDRGWAIPEISGRIMHTTLVHRQSRRPLGALQPPHGRACRYRRDPAGRWARLTPVDVTLWP